MPKSKREQKITLSRTGKKGRDRKQAIIEEVRECVDKYKSLYVFTANKYGKNKPYFPYSSIHNTVV